MELHRTGWRGVYTDLVYRLTNQVTNDKTL